MSDSFFNRIAIASASAGLTIASVLTFAHTNKVPLPCGGSNGCEQVAQDPSSYYLNIPVSVYGMAAYVVLLILSILRINGIALRFSSLAGLLISMLGMFGSGFLTYHSITKIHATCMWCIGSALMMVISTIAYFCTPKASEGIPEEGNPWSAIPWSLVPILGISAYAVFGHVTKEVPPDMSSVKLKKVSLAVLERSSRSLGQKSAPVVIAEFSDLMCPACRAMHQKLLMFMIHNKGKVRLLYHHFPLSKVEGHEDSQYAATLAEQLNDDDFWNYVSKVYGQEEKPSRGALDTIVTGFTGKRVRSQREAGNLVIKEMQIGSDYGVKITPTYIIFVNGKPTDVASSVNIKDVILKPIYAKIFAPAKAKSRKSP